MIQPITTSSSSATSTFARVSPDERAIIGIQALAGQETIAELSRRHKVSRDFVRSQRDTATCAIRKAFRDEYGDGQRPLFVIHVTGEWIKQVIVALVLCCHSSYRGVQEFLHAVLDHHVSVGSIANTIAAAAAKAEQLQCEEDLSSIRTGAFDEIFQSGKPVLAGVDPDSTYCFLLEAAEHRDETTWGYHLLNLVDKGLDVDRTVADFGSGLRAGVREALQVPCDGDTFHVLRELSRQAT